MTTDTFQRAVSDLLSTYKQNKSQYVYSVELEDYLQFKREYCFDMMKDISFGESFCKRFNVEDHMLNTPYSMTFAENYIKSMGYVKGL